MKIFSKILLITLACFFLYGCPEEDNQPDGNSTFKGYVYYSTGSKIYRINMKTLQTQSLFENASFPDTKENGKLLVCENYPKHKLIFTDLTGANRVKILELDGYMDHPRLSYDKKFIAYDGGSVYNPVTYVIDANSGEPIATIGDYSKRQPLYRPSWAPDGSIYVCGWTSMNNGIYKVSADYTTITRIDPDLSNVTLPAVSPDGKLIAFIRDQQVWTMNIDGTNPQQYYVSGETFSIPTWSPDSKYIISATAFSAYVFDVVNNTYTDINSGYISESDQMCWVY